MEIRREARPEEGLVVGLAALDGRAALAIVGSMVRGVGLCVLSVARARIERFQATL